MTLDIPFDNTYAQLAPEFYSRQAPTPVKAPRLIAFNDALAARLGITRGRDEELADIFGGNVVPPGADPLAQLYAGHQFGS